MLEFLREDRRGGPGRGQRRRLRAGALGARPDPGRARGLDRARGLPAAGRRGPPRAACSTATGWTSATPPRYLQASWDILEGRVETAVRPTAPGLFVAAGGRGRPPAPRSGRGRSSRRAARSRAGAEVARLGPARRAARVGAGAGSATRSSPPGSRWSPAPRLPTRSSGGMKESRLRDDDRRRPRHPRPACATRSGGSNRRAWSRAKPPGLLSAGWAARRSAATSPRRRSATRLTGP